MFKRVRPVIIAVENSADMVQDVKRIVEYINAGRFWEDFEITVNIFEILTDTANKEPCFVNYKDVSYFPKVVDNKDKKAVDLNPLLEYLHKFEFLSKRHLYVQPIVLFAMDGSNEYSFDEEKLCNFRTSYIYSSSLRALNFKHLNWRHGNHEKVINTLLNEGEEAESFLYYHLSACFEYAFWLMEETFPNVETDVIVSPRFPKDTIVVNGKIVRVNSKSPRKIARWQKEMKEFNRRYRF